MKCFWLVLALLLACGSPPPPKAPPAERAADAVADIAGRWVAQDDMDWGYSMVIEPAGVIDVWIDRGKQGRCEQKGTIEKIAAARTFRVIYTRGECNPQVVNVPVDMKVTSFTGDVLVVVVGAQSRTYQRAPEQGDTAERPAAQLTQ